MNSIIPANLTPTPDQLQQVATFAGHTFGPAWAWASSFLILIILFGLLFAFARVMDYGPYIALICALYIGYALYAAFPYASYLPSAPALTALAARLALYAAFFVASYLLLRKVAASDFIRVGTLGLIVISFLTAGFLMALAYQSFPVQSVYHFTPALDRLFAAKAWFFAWFIAPFVGLMLFTRGR
jgi:hypothetical protein